jgi:hypothetical protein
VIQGQDLSRRDKARATDKDTIMYYRSAASTDYRLQLVWLGIKVVQTDNGTVREDVRRCKGCVVFKCSREVLNDILLTEERSAKWVSE